MCQKQWQPQTKLNSSIVLSEGHFAWSAIVHEGYTVCCQDNHFIHIYSQTYTCLGHDMRFQTQNGCCNRKTNLNAWVSYYCIQNCVWHEGKCSQIAAWQDQLLPHPCVWQFDGNLPKFIYKISWAIIPVQTSALHQTRIQQNEGTPVINFYFSPKTAPQMFQADVMYSSLSSFCRIMKPTIQSQHCTQVISHLSPHPPLKMTACLTPQVLYFYVLNLMKHPQMQAREQCGFVVNCSEWDSRRRQFFLLSLNF